MKKTVLLLISMISLASGLAHAKGLDPQKPIVCSLSGARDLFLAHKTALIANNALFLIPTVGEPYRDGTYTCSADEAEIHCTGYKISITVDIGANLARVQEFGPVGNGRSFFIGACENQ